MVSKSSSVLTYYDVGNSTKNGFDVVREIRWLGGARICEVHLKDNPHYLGEGSIDFKAVVAALADIGFDGWAQLETDSSDRSALIRVKTCSLERLMHLNMHLFDNGFSLEYNGSLWARAAYRRSSA